MLEYRDLKVEATCVTQTDGTDLRQIPLDRVDGVVVEYVNSVLWFALTICSVLGTCFVSIATWKEPDAGIIIAVGVVAILMFGVLFLLSRRTVLQIYAGQLLLTVTVTGQSANKAKEFAAGLINTIHAYKNCGTSTV